METTYKLKYLMFDNLALASSMFFMMMIKCNMFCEGFGSCSCTPVEMVTCLS